MQKRKRRFLTLFVFATYLLMPWILSAQGFSCTFESASDSMGWVMVNGAQTNKWFIGNATASDGDRSLYISNYEDGDFNNYAISNSTVFAYHPIALTQSGYYRLEMDWRCNGYEASDYLRVALVPATTALTAGSLPEGVSTETLPEGWVAVDGGIGLNGENNWQHLSLSFALPTTGNYRLTFIWHNEGYSVNQPPAAVDNITLNPTDCPGVNALEVFPSPTSAFLQWEDLGDASLWEATVRRWGETHRSICSTDSITINGLSPNTEYTAVIRSICGTEDTSVSTRLSFTTTCEIISHEDLPYQYNFDDGYNYGTESGIGTCWEKGCSVPGTGFPFLTFDGSHSGDKSLCILAVGDTNRTWCLLPEFADSVQQLQLDFWASGSGLTTPTLKVGIMANDSFYLIDSIVIPFGWAHYTVPLITYEGPQGRICLMVECSTRIGTRALIDDIRVDVMPPCPAPSNLRVDSLSYNEAVLSWNRLGDVGAWILEYSDHAIVPGCGQSSPQYIFDTSFTLSGLLPNRTYYVYIRSNCGTNDSSEWINITLNTECDPIDAPFYEDFENWDYPDCWTVSNGSGSSGVYPDWDRHHQGDQSLRLFAESGNQVYLTLPLFERSLDSLHLRMWMLRKYIGGSFCDQYPSAIRVGTMTDPNNFATFSEIDHVTPLRNDEWNEVEVDFSGHSNMGRFLALALDNGPDNQANATIQIDDLTIEDRNNCPAPRNIRLESVSEQTATLAWEPGGNETSWMLYLDGDSHPCDTNLYTLEGLSPNQQYDIILTSVCDSMTESFQKHFTFLTSCGDADLPLMEDFDSFLDEGHPSCWTKVTNFFCAPGIEHQNFPTPTLALGGGSIAATPRIPLPANEISISFNMSSYSASSANLQVGFVSSLNNLNNITIAQSISPWIDYAHWENMNHYVIDFSNLSSTDTGYVVFKMDGSEAVGCWIDDLVIERHNPCARPTELMVVSQHNPDSVVIRWNSESAMDWELFIGPAHTQPGEDASITNITDTSYMFDNLIEGEHYAVYVRSTCGHSHSYWAGPLDIYPGTFFMPVEGEEIVSGCGIKIYDDGGPDRDYGSNALSTLVLRPASQDSILAISGTFKGEPREDYLTIYEGETAQGTPLATLRCTNPDEIVTLNEIISMHGSFTIVFYSNGRLQQEGFELTTRCIARPLCPHVKDIRVSNISGNSAKMDWEFVNGTTSFPYQYELVATDTLGNELTFTTLTKPFWLTGLSPATQYSVKIRSICPANLVSWWDSISFSTTCLTGGDITLDEGTRPNDALPISGYEPYGYTQQIVLYERIGTAGTLEGISFYSTAERLDKHVIDLYAGETTKSQFEGISDFVPTSSLTLVFSDTIQASQPGWLYIPFDTTLEYHANKNLLIAIDDNTGVERRQAEFLSIDNYPALVFFDNQDIDPNNPSGFVQNVTTAQNNMILHFQCNTTATCVAPNVSIDSYDTSSVALSWIPGLDESQWEISYRSQYDTAWVVDASPVYETHYTYHNLIPGMEYDFRVRSLCADSAATFLSLRTRGGSIIVPYVEDFEDYTSIHQTYTHVLPAGWVFVPSEGGSVSYGPQISYKPNFATTGSYCLQSSSAGTLILPPMNMPLRNVKISFDCYRANYGPLRLGVANNGHPYPSYYGYDIDVPCTTGALTHHEIQFTDLFTSDNQLTFIFEGSQGVFYIDHLTIDTAEDVPSCNDFNYIMSVDSTSYTTADLSILIFLESEIAYNHPGEPIGAQGSVIVADTIAHITDLEPGTEYEFRIRRICPDGGHGNWSTNVMTAQTECLPQSLPFEENFDWIVEDSTDMPICWRYKGKKPYVLSTGHFWYSDEGTSLLMRSGNLYSNGGTCYARLPEMDTPLNDLTISFWMSTERLNRGVLSVGYLRDKSFDSFVKVKDIRASGLTYHGDENGEQSNGFRDTISFSDAEEDAYCIAFKWENNAGSFVCCLDDITVNLTEAFCLAPSLDLPLITNTEATIGWHGFSDTYQYEVMQDSVWSDPVTTGDTTLNLSGLTPNTQYGIRVRQHCDSIFYSGWREYFFQTDSIACLVPEGLTVEEVDYSSALLSWTPAGEERQWAVHVWYPGFSYYRQTTNIPSVRIERLIQGQRFFASVKALCGANIVENDLGWSDAIEFQTNICPTVRNITSSVHHSAATIHWEGDNELGWEVRYRLKYDNNQTSIHTNANTITLDDLVLDTIYFFTIRGKCDENGYSLWSPEKYFIVRPTIDIEEPEEERSILIFPNPATGQVTIRLKGVIGNISLDMADVNGKKIRHDEWSCDEGCEKVILLNDIPSGFYFLRIQGDKFVEVRKLIVR